MSSYFPIYSTNICANILVCFCKREIVSLMFKLNWFRHHNLTDGVCKYNWVTYLQEDCWIEISTSMRSFSGEFLEPSAENESVWRFADTSPTHWHLPRPCPFIILCLVLKLLTRVSQFSHRYFGKISLFNNLQLKFPATQVFKHLSVPSYQD